ncbi:MAG: hypothetical protein HGA85_05930 [Nanoarchaeota archaeon]|nr:hypothetical protein [Nanoarchaeota archaeon]
MKKALFLVVLLLLSSCGLPSNSKMQISDASDMVKIPEPNSCCLPYIQNITDKAQKMKIMEDSISSPVCCDYAQDKEACLQCFNSRQQDGVRFDYRYRPSGLELAVMVLAMVFLFLTPLLWLITLVLTAIHLLKKVISRRMIIGLWILSGVLLLATVLLLAFRRF